MPYIFATTLLLYKLDTLLLKQNNLPVLDITGFFFRMSTQVKAEVLGLHLSTHAEKETRYIQYGRFFCFNSTVYKGNNKITELRTILQRESQNS